MQRTVMHDSRGKGLGQELFRIELPIMFLVPPIDQPSGIMDEKHMMILFMVRMGQEKRPHIGKAERITSFPRSSNPAFHGFSHRDAQGAILN